MAEVTESTPKARKRAVKRVKKDERVFLQTRVSPGTKERLEAFCTSRMVGRTRVVERALNEFFDRENGMGEE
jgi:hypothetical protein